MLVPEDGIAFTLKHEPTGLYLGTAGIYAGAEAVLTASSYGSAPRWMLQEYQSGHYLLNAADITMCLNVAYESKAAGARLQQWSCNGEQVKCGPLSQPRLEARRSSIRTADLL